MWQTQMAVWKLLGVASLASGMAAAVAIGGGTAPGGSWRLGEPVHYENLTEIGRASCRERV
jgi:hypothetical protein